MAPRHLYSAVESVTVSSETNRLPALSKARANGAVNAEREAKVFRAPHGVNLEMTGTPLRVPPVTPLPYSETNRLPALSQARPVVVFNPEAKVLLVPLGVNLKIA